MPIAFLIVAGSGMPGVGVRPGLRPFFNSSALGIPGVGVVPFGTTAPFVGIPGISLPFIGSGLADKPGGIFAGSNLTATFAFEDKVLVFPFELFETADEPHPVNIAAVPNNIAIDLIIKIEPLEI